MDIQTMGERIAALRRNRGASQEALAKAAGVSPQAVSKWECGGMPDTALLPAVADFLNVSIDRLFGREEADYSRWEEKTAAYLSTLIPEQRLTGAYRLCGAVVPVMMGEKPEKAAELAASLPLPDTGVYSQYLADDGLAMMSLSARLPYALVLPEPEEGWRPALAEDGAYTRLFAVLGNPDAFRCLMALYAGNIRLLTAGQLAPITGMPEPQAAAALDRLAELGLLRITPVGPDGGSLTLYEYNPNPALVPMLIFAGELLRRPQQYMFADFRLNKPYLAPDKTK